MPVRIVAASLLAAVLMFVAGATEHMALQWVDRTFGQLPSDQTARDLVKSNNLSPGMYPFPDFPRDWEDKPAEELEKMQADYVERYKEGPSGWIIVAPAGQEPMGTQTLLTEFAVNLGACFFAALLLTVAGPPRGFGRRFLMVLLLAPIGWLATLASHSIWYRFPWDFSLDELLCSGVDWAVAGLALAAIVRCRADGSGSAKRAD